MRVVAHQVGGELPVSCLDATGIDRGQMTKVTAFSESARAARRLSSAVRSTHRQWSYGPVTVAREDRTDPYIYPT
jgi:hypothetical protein